MMVVGGDAGVGLDKYLKYRRRHDPIVLFIHLARSLGCAFDRIFLFLSGYENSPKFSDVPIIKDIYGGELVST